MHNADAGRARMITLISVQLMDCFRDTGSSFSELRDTLRGPAQASGFEEIIARAVQRGELPDVSRPSRVLNPPLDLLRHDTVMTMRAMPDESIAQIVDEV